MDTSQTLSATRNTVLAILEREHAILKDQHGHSPSDLVELCRSGWLRELPSSAGILLVAGPQARLEMGLKANYIPDPENVADQHFCARVHQALVEHGYLDLGRSGRRVQKMINTKQQVTYVITDRCGGRVRGLRRTVTKLKAKLEGGAKLLIVHPHPKRLKALAGPCLEVKTWNDVSSGALD